MSTTSTNYWKGVIETIDLISGLSAKYYQGVIQGKELPELLEEIEAKASLKLTSGTNALVAELGLESVVGPSQAQKFDQEYWRAVKDTTAYARNWMLKNNPDESIFARFLYQIRKKAVQKLGEEVNPLEQELGDITVTPRPETAPPTPHPSTPPSEPSAEPVQVNLPSTTVRRSMQELSVSTTENVSPTTPSPPPSSSSPPPVEKPSPPPTEVSPPQAAAPSSSRSDVVALDELEQMEIPASPPPMRPTSTSRPLSPATPSRPATTAVPPRPVPPTPPKSSISSSPPRTTPSTRPPATPGIPDLSLLMSEDFEDLSKGASEERVPESIQELQRFEMEETPISPSEPTLRDALLGTASKAQSASSPSVTEEEDELSASLKSALKLLRDEED